MNPGLSCSPAPGNSSAAAEAHGGLWLNLDSLKGAEPDRGPRERKKKLVGSVERTGAVWVRGPRVKKAAGSKRDGLGGCSKREGESLWDKLRWSGLDPGQKLDELDALSSSSFARFPPSQLKRVSAAQI